MEEEVIEAVETETPEVFATEADEVVEATQEETTPEEEAELL